MYFATQQSALRDVYTFAGPRRHRRSLIHQCIFRRRSLMEHRSTSERAQSAISFADIYMRGAMRIADLQMSAMRVLLQTQGRRARMLGAPDWSHAFNGPSEQLSQLFNSGAEQALGLMRQTNETISEVNQQLGKVMQQQT